MAHFRKRTAILLAGVCLLAVVVAALLVFRSFSDGGGNRLLSGRDYRHEMYVHANVASVDPDIHEMTVRLQFTPSGRYGDPHTGRLRVPVSLLTYNVKGPTEYSFDRRKIMSPVEVTLGLTDGDPTSYPFDDYAAQLYFFIVRTDDKSKLGCDTEEVPTKLTLEHHLHPFAIQARDREHVFNRCFDANVGNYVQVHGVQNVRLSVARATTTQAFTVFIMLLMWALAFASVGIAFVLVRWRRDIGAGVLGFLAALLFALPAVRSVLPGTPPLGSLADYAALFWAEGIIAITFCFVAIKWLQSEMRDTPTNRNVD
jgi:hypothetical protein